jgi:hypothetical protein
MIRKFLVAFALLALVIASAGTVPAGSSYRVTLTQPSVVKGGELKPGEYKIQVEADKVTFTSGKTSVEAPVKIETGTEKFRNTAVRYTTDNGKANISEIRIGGTATRLLFN